MKNWRRFLSSYFVLLALLLHVLAFLALYFVPPARLALLPGAGAISIEVLHPKSVALNSGARLVRDHRNLPVAKKRPLISREALFPGRYAGPQFGSGNQTGKIDEGGGQGPSLTETLEMDPFLRAVLAKIDRAIEYPEEFVQGRVRGTVSMNITLTKTGQVRGAIQGIDSSKRILEVYTVFAVLKALQAPLPEKEQASRDINLHLFVKFEPYSIPGSVSDVRASEYNGTNLALTRRAFVDPEFNVKYNEFMRHYLPPIVIMPGGFMINFTQAYEIYETWNQPDPAGLRQFRLEQSELMFESLRAQALHR